MSKQLTAQQDANRHSDGKFRAFKTHISDDRALDERLSNLDDREEIRLLDAIMSGDGANIDRALDEAIGSDDPITRTSAYETGVCSDRQTNQALDDEDVYVRASAARHAARFREEFLEDEDPLVRHQTISRPDCPTDVRERLLSADVEVRRIQQLIGAESLDASPVP